VRVTEYAPSNLLEERRQLQVGAVKGIYVSLEDYERITDNYATILADSKTGNEILFMGTESIYNITPLSQGRRFVSPTTISTPAFNEQWTAYFEQYTDKRPDVIFIAKNTIDNRDKFFKYNDFGKWIAKYYDVEHMEETAYLCVLYPRKALMKSASID
jgi:hypothetical protein